MSPARPLRSTACASSTARRSSPGPRIAMYLGDFGADVIKVEHPERGDDTRHFGAERDGVSMYWKLVSRNKRRVTLNLSNAEGQRIARKLFATADVLIENFRPGTLERWNLAPDDPARGQPEARDRPRHRLRTGRSVREASRVRDARRGDVRARVDHRGAGRRSLLPPIALADEVTGMVGTWATLAALYWRDARGGTRTGDRPLALRVARAAARPPAAGLGPARVPAAAHGLDAPLLDAAQRVPLHGRRGSRSPRPRSASRCACSTRSDVPN